MYFCVHYRRGDSQAGVGCVGACGVLRQLSVMSVAGMLQGVRQEVNSAQGVLLSLEHKFVEVS